MQKNDLLRYHPERYRQTRPFAKRVLSAYHRINGLNPPKGEYLESVTNMIINSYNMELDTIERTKRPTDIKWLMKEPSIASYYSSFCSYGRNIFHLSDEIIEEFLQTDVGSIPLDAVDFPYECFYISFGTVNTLKLSGDGSHVDGAYVFAHNNFPLQVVLTTKKEGWNYANKQEWIFNRDKYYYMPLDSSDTTKTFELLVEKALQDQLEANKEDNSIPETGIHQLSGGVEVGVINKNKESSKKERDDILSGFDVFKNALNIIINTICYTSRYSDDIVEQWPEKTPKALLDKLNNAGNRKQKQKAKSQLISMGYTKLKLCGLNLKKQSTEHIDKNSIRPHWRRGHWRQQPYGEELKKKKIIWIRPTLVSQNKGSPETGHIYQVSNSNHTIEDSREVTEA